MKKMQNLINIEDEINYRKNFEHVNKIADMIDSNRRKVEIDLVAKEKKRLEARRLREYAEAQIEKERMKKMNKKIEANNEKFNQNK